MASITNGTITVEFSVITDEQVSRSSTVTESPIETGEKVNDHINASPPSFSLTGLIVGTDAAYRLSLLTGIWNRGDICSYTGRNGLSNVVITQFDSNHGVAYGNGLSFNITLKTVRITTPQEFVVAANVTAALAQKTAQVKKETNKGTQQKQTKKVDAVQEKKMTTTAATKAVVHKRTAVKKK